MKGEALTYGHVNGVMRNLRFRSLRVRVVLFAALTCFILLVLVGVLIGVLKNTQSATLRYAERHLHTVALSVGHDFYATPDYAATLTKVERVGPHPPPPGGPPPPPPPDAPVPPPPDRSAENAIDSSLDQLMSRSLASDFGIEGGFFNLQNKAMGGYAFPTHEAPGPPKEMPLREGATIENIALSAAQSGKEQHVQFQGPHDAILFEAIPLRSSAATDSPVIGAAWFMQRMPGVESEWRRQLLWGSLGFALIALLICAASFVVLSEVGGGLRAVTERLSRISTDIGSKETAHDGTRLAEFNDVLTGIDEMAQELHGKIQRERLLESQMAHRERLAAVGQFAAGIAHELRNPLATIRLRTQMSQGTSNREHGSDVNQQVVLAEVDRLNAMIAKLLHFAKPVQTHSELIELTSIAREGVQRCRERFGDKAVRFQEPTASVIVSGDADEFRQVFDNVLENAAQASLTKKGENEPVEVEIGVNEGLAVVTISDRGPGLDDESLRRALTPFYTTKERGTGLGLAISSEILRAHGGNLSIGNRSGGGASVRFEVPVQAQRVSPEGNSNA